MKLLKRYFTRRLIGEIKKASESAVKMSYKCGDSDCMIWICWENTNIWSNTTNVMLTSFEDVTVNNSYGNIKRGVCHFLGHTLSFDEMGNYPDRTVYITRIDGKHLTPNNIQTLFPQDYAKKVLNNIRREYALRLIRYKKTMRRNENEAVAKESVLGEFYNNL